jgi:hypothetical protein
MTYPVDSKVLGVPYKVLRKRDFCRARAWTRIMVHVRRQIAAGGHVDVSFRPIKPREIYRGGKCVEVADVVFRKD